MTLKLCNQISSGVLFYRTSPCKKCIFTRLNMSEQWLEVDLQTTYRLLKNIQVVKNLNETHTNENSLRNKDYQ